MDVSKLPSPVAAESPELQSAGMNLSDSFLRRDRFEERNFRASEPVMSFADVRRILLRRWKTILLCLVLAMISAGSFLVLATDTYRATASLEVQRPTSVVGEGAPSSGSGAEEMGDYIATTVAKAIRRSTAEFVLTSAHLTEEVAQVLRVNRKNEALADDKNGSQLSATDRERLLKGYLNLVKVRAVPGTSLIEISASSPSPNLSRDLANAHATLFVEQVNEEMRAALKNRERIIREEVEDLRARLDDASRAVTEYAEQKGLLLDGGLGAQDDSLHKSPNRRIDELTNALGAAVRQRLQLESAVREARRAANEGFDVNQSAVAADLLARLSSVRGMQANL